MSLQSVPTYDDWKLKSVDMKLSGSSVKVKSEVYLTDGNESYIIPKTDNTPIPAHGDLMDALNALKVRLASDFGYTAFDALVKSDLFGAAAGHVQFANRLLEEQLEMIQVTGIAYPGKNRRAIKIKGTYGERKLETATLSFDNSEYGAALEEAVNLVSEEVYEYLFLGKKAQLDIAFLD